MLGYTRPPLDEIFPPTVSEADKHAGQRQVREWAEDYDLDGAWWADTSEAELENPPERESFLDTHGFVQVMDTELGMLVWRVQQR